MHASADQTGSGDHAAVGSGPLAPPRTGRGRNRPARLRAAAAYLDALEGELAAKHAAALAALSSRVDELIDRQRRSAERLAELRAQVIRAADQHGRARLAAGHFHTDPAH
jgi:hypothetical protein